MEDYTPARPRDVALATLAVAVVALTLWAAACAEGGYQAREAARAEEVAR